LGIEGATINPPWGKQPRVVFALGKGEFLDFPSMAFDAAWSSSLLHLYRADKRNAILRWMWRVFSKKVDPRFRRSLY